MVNLSTLRTCVNVVDSTPVLWSYFLVVTEEYQYTAITINVFGLKYKDIRQDLKILWIFYE